MATQGSKPSQTQVLFERLCQVLADLRPGVHMPEMALSLLRPTHDGRVLVGLLDGGDRALYYHYASQTLSSVPFDAHGLRPGETELLARDLHDPSDWVYSHRERVTWVRREYRDNQPRPAGGRDPQSVRSR